MTYLSRLLTVAFALSAVLTVTSQQRKPSLLESLIHLVMVDGSNNVMKEPKDERYIDKVRMKLIISQRFQTSPFSSSAVAEGFVFAQVKAKPCFKMIFYVSREKVVRLNSTRFLSSEVSQSGIPPHSISQRAP